MENLEQRCLEKLNKLLSKFDLKIEIVHIASLSVWQYRLVDNLTNKSDWKVEWLGLWLSLNDLLFRQQSSIFECLDSYYDAVNSSSFKYIRWSDIQLSRLQRCSKAYQFIQQLKSCCLEEFIIRCDLLDI
jgi:hypothetical protein